MRSPSWNRSLIISCKRIRRCAAPFMAAIAQTRRAFRNWTNCVSSRPRLTRGRGADPIRLERSSCKQLFDPLGRCCLIDPLDRSKLAHQAIERGLVNLPLAIRLLRLTDIAIEVANHLGDRTGITGGDLGLIFLSAPAPHRSFSPRATSQLGEGCVHLLAARQPA